MKTQLTRSILCGTDFSENASQACAAAAVLAKRWNKPLVVLHAADEFNAHAETKEGLEYYLRRAYERLKSKVERLARNGATVSGEVLRGRRADRAILEYAEEHPTDLVVVSAVSKAAFDRWTLGSVSERVAAAMPAVTLVVRAAEPFEAWARGDRALKIFVAADSSDCSTAALRWVGELRKLGPCEVTAAYVDWPPEERNRLGIYGPLELVENVPKLQSVLERDLRKKVAFALGDEQVEILVRAGWGRVDVHLVRMAEEAGADLLVVGTHQWRGLERLRHGSVSRGILRHAPMSVACVPAVAPHAPAIPSCRRVLTAVDLTDQGGLALPYAYSLVEEGGTVELVHVVKPLPLSLTLSTEPELARQLASQNASRVAEASAHLRSMVPVEADARGVQTDFEILEDNNVAGAICQASETFDADLVCIGAHARPGATARMMGSVALGVLQHCRRPVLVVWPPAA